MNDANKEIVRRFVDEVFHKGNPALLDEFIDEEIVSYDPSDPTSPIQGREAYRTSVESWLAAFPVRHAQIDDQVAEGDKVATRFTFAGRYEGGLFGPSTAAKDIEFTGIYIDRIHNGRIVEEWFNWDALGLMRQLGLVPEPEA